MRRRPNNPMLRLIFFYFIGVDSNQRSYKKKLDSN